MGALNDPAVPQPVRQALAAQGFRIFLDEGGPAAEIWFRKSIQGQPKNPNADAVYDRLSESTFVGVLHFVRGSNDYRGQSVPAGFYTLRYALMPNDGDHLGVAPSRDFLLLIPATVDPGHEATPKASELFSLSRQASGTRHPAPLSLVSAEGRAPTGISKDDEGHSIFTTTLHLSSGEELPLALVVKGTAPQ
jgi:hypothetical protein